MRLSPSFSPSVRFQMSIGRNVIFFALVIHIIPVLLGIVSLINWIVPAAYMDEVFHIPQSQAYCSGHWSHWDEKITTLPGSYLIFVVLSYAWTWIQAFLPEFARLPLDGHPVYTSLLKNGCSTATIRIANTLLAITTLVYIFRLVILNTKRAIALPLLVSFWIFLFPVFFFFVFLVYTDVASVTFVLIALYHSLRFTASRSMLQLLGAAAAAAYAVFIRQTNVVWVGYLLAVVVAHTAIPSPSSSLRAIPSHISAVMRYICSVQILQLSPLLTVIALFLAFVRYNGSIVVGDKQHHVAVVHLAQLNMIVLATAAILMPFLLLRMLTPATAASSPSPNAALTHMRPWTISVAAALCFSLLTIMFAFTAHTLIPHPFLLADNRHYTFYLFRLLTRNPIHIPALSPHTMYPLLLLLAPITAFLTMRVASLWLNAPCLRSPLLPAAWLCCNAAAVVPTPLIEPRYYLTAAVIAAVEIGRAYCSDETEERPAEVSAICVNGIGMQEASGTMTRELSNGDVCAATGKKMWMYIFTASIAGVLVVNVVILYIFLYRPFVASDGSVGRFMF